MDKCHPAVATIGPEASDAQFIACRAEDQCSFWSIHIPPRRRCRKWTQFPALPVPKPKQGSPRRLSFKTYRLASNFSDSTERQRSQPRPSWSRSPLAILGAGKKRRCDYFWVDDGSLSFLHVMTAKRNPYTLAKENRWRCRLASGSFFPRYPPHLMAGNSNAALFQRSRTISLRTTNNTQ